jgi:hypothetical protein
MLCHYPCAPLQLKDSGAPGKPPLLSRLISNEALPAEISDWKGCHNKRCLGTGTDMKKTDSCIKRSPFVFYQLNLGVVSQGVMVKTNVAVHLDPFLRLATSPGVFEVYRLLYVVLHRGAPGRDLSSGHFKLVYFTDGEWWCADDSSIYRVAAPWVPSDDAQNEMPCGAVYEVL